MHGNTRSLTAHIGRSGPTTRQALHCANVRRSLRARLTSGWAMSLLVLGLLMAQGIGFCIALGYFR